MSDKHRRTHAFTLIELLTVIAIIALLAALLFPAIKSALLKAEVGKAQQQISGLQTAFKAYYTEYGVWPATELPLPPQPPKTIYVSSKLIGLLRGENNGGTVSASTDANPSDVFYNGNARHIVFLEFKAQDLVLPSGSITNFVDPWKRVYYCRFDREYNNSVDSPFYPNPPPTNAVNVGSLVWSDGPDALEDTGGDVPPSQKNKDNVKSW